MSVVQLLFKKDKIAVEVSDDTTVAVLETVFADKYPLLKVRVRWGWVFFFFFSSFFFFSNGSRSVSCQCFVCFVLT